MTVMPWTGTAGTAGSPFHCYPIVLRSLLLLIQYGELIGEVLYLILAHQAAHVCALRRCHFYTLEEGSSQRPQSRTCDDTVLSVDPLITMYAHAYPPLDPLSQSQNVDANEITTNPRGVVCPRH